MATKNKKIKFEDLGIIEYYDAFAYQESLMQGIIDLKILNREKAPENQQPTPNYFLFVEHPHIYTLGKSGKEQHLLINEQKIRGNRC